ncbi:RING/U-box superfamily protein [Striga asiatica]|uniref:RING/U-box superfamily protein n=1 Tax=Striga asiatica TaxID=4170 RepID=A0A5A7P5C4_STRAF|nr:RING/U-box superfamily protein [Striga asiatica]
MSENQQQQLELHYMDCGYFNPISEGFTDVFGGFSSNPYQYVEVSPMHDQEFQHWSMHTMNSYRYGLSGQESSPYYGVYENIDHASRMDFSRRGWDYPSVTNTENPLIVDAPPTVSTVHTNPEECTPDQEDAVETRVFLEDDIDPDIMTYEELLDLGETVGTQSRGLSQELINQLPISKHKSGGIFSRKKSGDRCVICQMRYKRGDRQINLPCKHAYHANCGTKWLSINKTCPICSTEVFGDESSH